MTAFYVKGKGLHADVCPSPLTTLLPDTVFLGTVKIIFLSRKILSTTVSSGWRT
jgi:hypothetical protein